MASGCFSMLNCAAVRVTTANRDFLAKVIIHKPWLPLVVFLILMAAITVKIHESRYLY
jgi:hypothetical protein